MTNIEKWEEDFDSKWVECNCNGGFDYGQCHNEEGGHSRARKSIKDFIRTALQDERICIAEEVQKNMSYAGVLDSNEKRRGYDIAVQEVLSIIKQDENKPTKSDK